MAYTCVSLASSLYENSDGLLDVHFPVDSGFEIDEGLALVDSERAPIWTNFIPDWAGIAVGNGVQRARYMKVNKLIFYSVVLNFGSTTSFTGSAYFTPPIAMADPFAGDSTNIYAPCGQTWFEKPGTNYQGVALQYNGKIHLATGLANSTYMYLQTVNGTSNVPWVWASGDQMIGTGWYRAA